MRSFRRNVACVVLAFVLGIGGCPPQVSMQRGDPNAGDKWGINAHLPSARELDLINQAGIGWVRISFNWHLIEPTDDAFEWAPIDECVSRARSLGLRLLPVLAYTPAWANDSGRKNDPPSDTADWRDFVYRAVDRYKDDVQHWTIWNEPNGGDGEYWSGTPAEFRDLIVKPAIEAARRADPGCFLAAPGVTIHTGWAEWMETVLTPEVAADIDIVSVHLYVTGDADDLFWHIDGAEGPWEDIPTLQQVLTRLELTDKAVWMLETGWQTGGENGVGLQGQADRYHDLLWGIHMRGVIDKVFPYELVDPGEGDDPPTYGLLDASYEPKPAMEVYEAFIANPTPRE